MKRAYIGVIVSIIAINAWGSMAYDLILGNETTNKILFACMLITGVLYLISTNEKLENYWTKKRVLYRVDLRRAKYCGIRQDNYISHDNTLVSHYELWFNRSKAGDLTEAEKEIETMEKWDFERYFKSEAIKQIIGIDNDPTLKRYACRWFEELKNNKFNLTHINDQEQKVTYS